MENITITTKTTSVSTNTLLQIPTKRKNKRPFAVLLLLLLILFLGGKANAQNAIVGNGFSTGWGSPACAGMNNTNFKYLNLITGAAGTGTYGVTTVANGTGNQYMRFGKDWSSTYAQYAITPGIDTQITPNTQYSLNTTCTNSGSQYVNVGSTSYNYVFKTLNAGTAPTGTFVMFEVQGAVQTITSVTASPSVVPINMPVTITANLSGALSTGQDVYLRYTNDAWSTSTVVKMTSSTATAYLSTIPGQTSGKVVSYYTFTSGTSGVLSNGSNADLFTINWNAGSVNGGSNYSYTTGTTAQNVWVTSTGGTGSAGAAYTTLAAAFTAINAGTHTGAITVTILANTTEPATIVSLLKSGAPSSYTSISIKPSGNRTITASTVTANNAVINLLGADNVTIDGDDPSTSGTQNLTVTMPTAATTAKSVINLSSNSTTGTDGCDNVTIKNCILIGSRSTATNTQANYGIALCNASTPATGAYSSINTIIQNNNITRCWNGINANGTSATYPNTGLQILNNTIGTPTSGTFADATSVGNRGVLLSYTATTTGGAIVRENDIRVGVTTTGYTNSIAGIEIGAGNYGVIIDRNNIHDIVQPMTTGYGSFGIYVTGATNNTVSTISNNIIRDVKMVAYQTASVSAFIPSGIYFSAGATGVDFVNNTIVMGAQLATGNWSSFCVNASVSGVRFTKFLNNILVNTHTSTYAFGLYTNIIANISAATMNNNNYYVPNTGQIGYYNTANRSTLSAWQTATSKDANSYSVNPSFVSATNLHLNTSGNTVFESTGATTATSGITSDYDGQTRPGPTGSVNGGGTAPDIGADEFDGVPATPCAVPNVPTALTFNTVTTNSLNGSFTAPSPAPTSYIVIRSTSSTLSAGPVNGTTYTAGSSTIGGGNVVALPSTTTFSDSGLTASTLYYYFVYAVNSGTCTGSPKYSTTNITNNQATVCAAATALADGTLTSTSATLTWTGTGNYVVEYGAAGFTPGTGATAGVGGTIATSIATTPYVLSGLSLNTTYDVYVRQVCAVGGLYSANSTKDTFTTLQMPTTLPYTQNFNSTNDFIFINGSQTNKWSYGSATGNTGASLYVSTDSGVTNTYNNGVESVVQAYRDFIVPSGTTTSSFSFNWKANGETCCDYFRVWLAPASFTPIAGTQITAGSGRIQIGTNFNVQTSWQTYSNAALNLSSYANTTMRLIFEWRNDNSVGTSPPVAIDNVSLTVPTCGVPTIAATNNIAETTASINWTAPASAPSNGYNYEIRTSGTAGSGATGLTTSGAVAAGIVTLNITSLTAATIYSVYIQSNCGGETSLWSTAGTFTTACTVPNNPGTISVTAPSATGFTLNYAAATPAPTNYILFNSTGTVATAIPTLVTGTTYTNDIAYTFGGNSYNCISNTSASPQVLTGGTSNTQYNYFLYSKNTTNSCFGNPYYSTGISVSTITCPAAPTLPVVSLVTDSSATLTWTASVVGGGAGTINYTLEVYTDAGYTTPISGSPFTMGTSVSQALTGLSASTTYYYRVKATNGSCDSAYLTGTLTLACGAITSFPSVEPFASYLPSVCWKEGDLGDLTAGPFTTGASVSDWVEDGFLNSSTTGAAKMNIDTATGSEWIISPYYTIPATGYRVKYSVGATQWNAATALITAWEADDFVELLVSTSNTNWTVLKTYNSATVPSYLGQTDDIDLTAYNGQTVQFAFRAFEGAADGPADIDFFIDNFTVEQTPPSITITPSPNATICQGDSTTLTASSTAGYTYTWSPATGLSATTGAAVTANPTTTTTYTVIGVAGTISTTQTVTVTVNPAPAAVTITPSATTCPNAVTTLTASSASIGTYTVGTSSGSSVGANTPYKQSVGIANQSRVQYLITKAELNAAGINSAANLTSLGFNVTTAGAGTMSNYTISMTNSNLTVLTATYQTPTFTTVFTGTNILPVTGINTHTFSSPFAWDGSSNILINICHQGAGGTVSIVSIVTPTNESTTSGGGNNQCNLTTGGATNANRPVITFGVGGLITWTPTTDLYTDAGATTAYTGTVAGTVYTKPTATRTYTATATLGSCTKTNTTIITTKIPVGITSVTADASPICSTATTSLTANGVVGDNAVVTWYTGAGGTGTTLGTGATLVAGPGTYYAIVTGDCGIPAEASVTVETKVTIGITSITAVSNSVCSTETTTLTANGVVGTNNLITWYTGTGGTGTNLGTEATLTAGPGTYYAYVTGDCGSPVEANITIGTKVNVGITNVSAAANPICATATTTLTANSVLGTNALVTWWTGSGGTGTNLGTGLTISVGPGNYYARVTGDCGTPQEASYIVNTTAVPTYVNLQFPSSGSTCQGGTFTSYGRVYQAGITEAAGAGSGITAQFGYSTSNTDPSTWTNWSTATFNAQTGNDDEYTYIFSPPLSGTYYYAYRYRQGTCDWLYGGNSGTTGGFWNGTTNVNGVLTVNSNAAHTISLSSGSSTPALCQNTLLGTNMVYAIGGGATGAGVTGLPSGMSGSFSSGTFTISGTPTTGGTYNYTVTTTGNGCATAVTALGTITVSSTLDFVNLQFPASGSICQTSTFTAYGQVFETGVTPGAGQGAGITVEFGYNDTNSNPSTWTNWFAASYHATVTGNNDEYQYLFTPTSSGTYYYTYRYKQGTCDWQYGGYTSGGGGTWSSGSNVSGVLTVNPAMTATAASTTPTLCISTSLTAISHTTTGATGIGTATNLPAGVTAAFANNTITISGTPTASGTFNYSIPLTGGCGSVNATGTITVTPAMTTTAASTTPTLCISTALTAITHTTTGATGIGTATNLPTGVTAAFANNTITISGTPSESGIFNYSIPLTGGCGSVNATGTITVNANLPASVSVTASPSGAICSGTSVTFTASPTNGGATPAYQWYVGATPIGTNSATFTSTTLVDSDVVTVQMTSNASPCLTGSPATSTGINMTVNPVVTASVSIAASATTICTGTSVTFTATPTNGGAAPTYQWYVGTSPVGTDSTTFTSTTIANNDAVTVVMTSNATPCLTDSPATSNAVTMTVPTNTTWVGTNGNWNTASNWSCGTVPAAGDTIVISSGTPTLNVDFTVNAGGSLTLSDTGALIISSHASLTVAGTAAFNARPITFKSDASGTAAFGEVTGTVTGATNVTVERHFPAQRAFRFATSAVTTNTSIKNNWQEGVNNADTVYANNQNPNPGYGTHITGTGGSTNGFDTTVSNSASMFGFNNTTAAWTAVTNTNNNILTAGTPYRINIRGSRSVDMSLTSPAASATTLRANGALAIGTVSAGTLSSSAYAYNFIGNPYQAPVNMKTALEGGTNLNTAIYYIWDRRMNSKGAYISVDLGTNTPNNGSSGANKYLQPGQACFIRTGATAGSASLNFQESYKVVSSPNTSVFRADTQNTTALSTIKLRLFDSNSLALNLNALDGLVVFFDDAFSSSVDQNDGGKLANPDEMLSTFNNGALISIEKRQHPTSADIIPLRASQYRVTDYTMVAEGTNLNGVPAYLHDQFLQTYTEIPQSGVVNYPFNVVTTNTQTTASDRFRIVYTNPLLNTNNTEWMNFTMYPNPSKQGNFNIILPQQINNGKVTIYTTLGKEIYTQNIDAALQTTITPKQQLATGIYYVVLEFESNKSVKKLIIE